MALVAMNAHSKLHYLVSQNVDGLHLRSGIPRVKLAELHGNLNVDKCDKCGEEFYRSCAKVNWNEAGKKTYRDVICPACGKGGVRDSIVHFGDQLPRRALVAATHNSRTADLGLVLGTSLTVSPACDVPLQVVRSNKPLVIVNLQPTPLDDVAALRIWARTDKVMQMMCTELKWVLKLKATHDREFFCRGNHCASEHAFAVVSCFRWTILCLSSLHTVIHTRVNHR
ncbi:hypothetical protein HDU93_004584, partial [Gonapodya sp. JEL0774]